MNFRVLFGGQPAIPKESPEAKVGRFKGDCFRAAGGRAEYAEEVLKELNILLPNETLDDIGPLQLPTTRRAAQKIYIAIMERSGVDPGI